MNQKAFTLVELIVTIILLAILSSISFITINKYIKESRDSKRISDINSLITKINLQNIKWIDLNELIETQTWYTLKINNKNQLVTKWIVNFNNLKEDEKNFKDPKYKNINYPVAFSKKWDNSLDNYIQFLSYNESTNQALLIWNYFQNSPEDASSLIINDIWNIINNWEIGNPYFISSLFCYATNINWYKLEKIENWNIVNTEKKEDIKNIFWKKVWELTKKTEFLCDNWIFKINSKENIEDIICYEWENYEWTICHNWWEISENAYLLKNLQWIIIYPKECNDLIKINDFKVKSENGLPFDWKRFINWIYYIKPDWEEEAYKVYCDMETDWGGWTLAFYGNHSLNTIPKITFNDILVNWKSIKTYTSKEDEFPSLKDWSINNFHRLLFKWGNATWQKEKWDWSSLDIYPEWTTTIWPSMNWAISSNGVNGLYITGRWWWRNTMDTTGIFSLWNANWQSNICWWANNSKGKNCPYFNYSIDPYHYDFTSHKELYLRGEWTCFWKLPETAIATKNYKWNNDWNYSLTPWACTFICEDWLSYNLKDCVKHWWFLENDWYKFRDIDDSIIYPKTCNDIVDNDIFKTTWLVYNTNLYQNWFMNWIYYIKPDWEGEAYKVYCDMETQWGGWTLVFYGNNSSSVSRITFNDILVNWKAIKSYTSKINDFPTIKNWTINNFSKLLFKWGNATWQGQKWNWSIIDMYPEWTTSIWPSINWVLNANGSTDLYIYRRWWWENTMATSNIFWLWNANWQSNICWWANNWKGKNCPYFSNSSSSYHYDSSSHRELYLK